MRIHNKTKKLTITLHTELLAWWWGYEARCVSRKASVKII